MGRNNFNGKINWVNGLIQRSQETAAKAGAKQFFKGDTSI